MTIPRSDDEANAVATPVPRPSRVSHSPWSLGATSLVIPIRRRSSRRAPITPNYKDADLSQIIEAVSAVTGKNFIVDPRVKAQVTMLSSTPMTPDAFYEAFLSILQVHGFVAVPSGNMIKIIPDANARQVPGQRPALARQLQFRTKSSRRSSRSRTSAPRSWCRSCAR